MALGDAAGLLACPVCAEALQVSDAVARCPGGHSFDVARQGYLNLLGQASPGNADTPAMLDARQRVLAGGMFAALTDDIATRVRRCRTLLEVGAGTGHYLAAALDRRPDSRGVALDVSVAAAKRASRAHPRLASVVADAWRRLPLRSGRFDAVLSVFAPRNLEEFHRVLAEGGLLLVVLPNEGHLRRLRHGYDLLEVEPDKEAKLLRAASGRFDPIAAARVHQTLDGTSGQVADLIAMGPNAFHQPRIEAEPGPVDIDVTVCTFRRAGSPH